MDQEESKQLWERIANLEQQLRVVTEKLDELQKEKPQQIRESIYPGPPPIISSQPRPRPYLSQPTPVRPNPQESFVPRESQEPSTIPPKFEPPKPVSSSDVSEVEYKIGTKGLMWAGAAAVVLGILFLVIKVIQEGMITPQVQFAGEILLSLSFIGFGLYKRDEKEEFGQLLVGIGSCGMYLSLAGAHIWKGFYSAEVLVALFFAWSLVNLAFSLWRSSQTFLVIGLLGGFIAALMPLDSSNVPLSLVMHFGILVPAGLIISRNKWWALAYGLSIVSTLVILPAVFTPSANIFMRLAALYANTLWLSAIYIFSKGERTYDPKNSFVPVFLVITALLGFIVKEPSLTSSGYLLSFGLAAGFMAFLFRERAKVWPAYLIGALIIGTLMTPFGFTPLPAAFTYAGLCVLFSAASIRQPSVGALALAGTAYVFGLIGYTTQMTVAIPAPGLESLLMLLYMGASICFAYGLHRLRAQAELAFQLGTVLCLVFLSRFAYAFFGHVLPFDGSVWLTLTLVLASAALALVVQKQKWADSLGLVWVTLITATVAYAYFVFILYEQLGTSYYGLESVLLLSIIAGVLVNAWSTRHTATTMPRSGIVIASGLFIGLFFVRLFNILVLSIGLDVGIEMSFAYGVTLYGFVCTALCYVKRWPEAAWLAWGTIILSCFSYLTMTSEPRTQEFVLTSGLLALTAVTSWTHRRTLPTRSSALVNAALFFGACLLGRWIFLILDHPSLAVSENDAVRMSFILVGFAINAMIVIRKWQEAPWFAWAALTIALSHYTVQGAATRSGEALIILVLMTLTALTANLHNRYAVNREHLIIVASLICTCLFTRLGYIGFTAPNINITPMAAVTATWTLFASTIMALGFIYRTAALRYIGLASFGATIFKVFMVDLAELSPLTKFGILIALGIAMLCGAYVYIKVRQNTEKAQE